MRRTRVPFAKIVRPVLLAALALALGACLVVREDADGRCVDRYFASASRDIAAMAAQDARRPRRPRRACILIHDAEDGTLVRLSVPLWLVNLGLKSGLKAEADGHDFDVRTRYDLEWRSIPHVERFGRGLLVSVEDGRSRVLVWLR
jgi:hypothetical protein